MALALHEQEGSSSRQEVPRRCPHQRTADREEDHVVDIQTHGVLTRVWDGSSIALLLPGAIEEVPAADWLSATCDLLEGPDFWFIDGSGGVVVWLVNR